MSSLSAQTSSPLMRSDAGANRASLNNCSLRVVTGPVAQATRVSERITTALIFIGYSRTVRLAAKPRTIPDGRGARLHGELAFDPLCDAIRCRIGSGTALPQ